MECIRRGAKVWIGRYDVKAEDVYWTDSSYIVVPESEATKVSYHEAGNHSAIKLDNYWYQSKWGWGGGLIKHSLTGIDPAYQPSMLKIFYKLAPIIGPDQLCLTPQTYSLPAGCLTGNWSVSGSIQFDTQNTTNVNSVTVKPSAYNGNGTLKAVASNGLTYVKYISTCTNSIIGSEFVCSSVTYTTTFGPVSSWSIAEGSVTGPYFTLTPNGNSATITISPGSPYQFATLTAVVNGLPISKEIWTHAIAGPETICYSFNYSLTTGEIPVWSLTNMSCPTGFTFTTTNNGATAAVTATLPAGQTATLQAVANGRTHALNIKACQGYISGPDYLCGTATYTLDMTTALWWTTGGEGISIVSSTPTTATVTVDPAYNGKQVAVIAILSCGGIAKNFIISCGSKSSGSNDSFFIAYPNPTSEILYIDINDTAAARSALDPTYDIRLYDMQGNQLRQTNAKKNGKVQFNVANLPDGTYFLHIYDGINAQPNMQQIIINH